LFAVRKCLEDEGAERDRDLEIIGGVAGLVGALAVLTAFRLELGVIPEVDEGVLAGCGNDVDRSTAATVAAVGTAAGDVFLASETEATATTASGSHVDVDFVYEHEGIRSCILIPGSYSCTGMTLIRRPC